MNVYKQRAMKRIFGDSIKKQDAPTAPKKSIALGKKLLSDIKKIKAEFPNIGVGFISSNVIDEMIDYAQELANGGDDYKYAASRARFISGLKSQEKLKDAEERLKDAKATIKIQKEIVPILNQIANLK